MTGDEDDPMFRIMMSIFGIVVAVLAVSVFFAVQSLLRTT